MTLIQSLAGFHALWQLEVALRALFAITAVLGTALLVLRRARAFSPAVRHGVLTCALLLAFAAPLTTGIAPVVPLTYDLPAGLAHLDNAPHLGPLRSILAPLLGAGELGVPSGSPYSGPGPLAWLAVAWAIVAGALGLRLLVGLRRLLRAVGRDAAPASRRVIRVVARERASLEVPQRVRVLVSDRFAVPFTMGLRRPVILLPAVAEAWTDATLGAAVRHELAHVSRRDWAAQMVGLVTCVVFWFHPLAWWTAREQRHMAELAADARVLVGGPPARTYARALYDLATNGVPCRTRGKLPETAVALAPASALEFRIRALACAEQARFRDRRWPLLVVIVAGLAGSGLTAPVLGEACREVEVAAATGLPTHPVSASSSSMVATTPDETDGPNVDPL